MLMDMENFPTQIYGVPAGLGDTASDYQKAADALKVRVAAIADQFLKREFISRLNLIQFKIDSGSTGGDYQNVDVDLKDLAAAVSLAEGSQTTSGDQTPASTVQQIISTISPGYPKDVNYYGYHTPAGQFVGPLATPSQQAPAGVKLPSPPAASTWDTISSIFGGLTAAAPGAIQSATMFQRPQKPAKPPKLPTHPPAPPTPWGRYLLIGGAVIAAGFIAYKVVNKK